MRLVVHIESEERPEPPEVDFAALNVWGEMVLATIYVGKGEVSEADGGGWDMSFNCEEIVSFPYSVVTEDNVGEHMKGRDSEIALVGTVALSDGYDWDEASEEASATLVREGAEPVRCSGCRIVMRRRKGTTG